MPQFQQNMIRKYLSLSFILFVLGLSVAAQDKPADTDAKLISAPAFAISAEDEAAGIDGSMKIALDVNKSGEVANAVVYVGPMWPCTDKLDSRVVSVMRDAEKFVRTYKFSPAIKDGKPVATRVGIKVTIGRAAHKDSPLAVDPNVLKVKTVTGGVVNGKALSLPKPDYPVEAKQARAGGAVSVQVLIGEEGNVLSAQAIDGSPLLQFAARASACGAKFSPTLLVGQPVKVSGVITYNFVP